MKMVNLNNTPKWKDIQSNAADLTLLIEAMSKKGTVGLQELGQLSFLFALLLEQTEKIISKERNEKQNNSR